MTEETQVSGEPGTAKPERPRPSKRLPTNRLSFEKQLEVLRAYAAASGNERKAVSNAEVGGIVQLNPDSVSLCNPFWIEIQLLTRDGNRQRPSSAVFDYWQAYQWHPETAANKLADVMAQAWFSKALLPKLGFRALSKADALRYLAEEAKAPKEYEASLSLVLDYMKAGGLIVVENGTVSLPPRTPEEMASRTTQAFQINDSASAVEASKPSGAVQSFKIPIPGKADAVINVPADLDAEDWAMLSEMLETYVMRWKKFRKPSTQKGEAENA